MSRLRLKIMSTSLRLPPELEADIKELASEHDRSEHGEMVFGLRTYVEQQKELKKMSQNRPCIIGVGLPPDDHKAIKSGLEHLHTLFNHVDGKQEQAGFNVLCAGPKNGLSYDETFILCQKRYYEVGWVYADTPYEAQK